MKRILIGLILLVMGAIIAASYAVRKAPEWMRSALEQSLSKSVSIRSIDFQFPMTFVLTGVKISEKDGPFAGEPDFSAETVELTALPTSLRGAKLVVDAVEVREAVVTVRKSNGVLYHALSQPAVKDTQPNASSSGPLGALPKPQELLISFIRLEGGRFQFEDYDIQSSGFVFDCEVKSVRISSLRVPAGPDKIPYQVEGRLLQGRDEKPAVFHFSGTTVPSTLDSQMQGQLRGLHLTYFAPYFSRVTPAAIQEGYLDLDAQGVIQSGELALDAKLAFTSLFFESLEENEQLFGLSAHDILNFLKDSSGRLRIPVSVRWNFRDPSVRLRDVVRRSMETSLKATVFGNVGAFLEKAIGHIGEKGFEAPQKTSETVLKKIKDFLKY